MRHRERYADRARILLGARRDPGRPAPLDEDADRIAQDPFDVDALVESTWQPLAVKANAQVLRASDESTGALFDALA